MTREEVPDSPPPPMTEIPLDFTAFHQTRRPKYIRAAESVLGSRHDAEEAVDDTFYNLYRRWDCVLTQPDPDAYAWKALKNSVISFLRARRRRPVLGEVELFETVGMRDAANPIEALQTNLDILQAEQRLAGRQREVFVLLHRLGWTPSEAAEILGVAEATIRSTDRYAKQRLQQLLTSADLKGDPSR